MWASWKIIESQSTVDVGEGAGARLVAVVELHRVRVPVEGEALLGRGAAALGEALGPQPVRRHAAARLLVDTALEEEREEAGRLRGAGDLVAVAVALPRVLGLPVGEDGGERRR